MRASLAAMDVNACEARVESFVAVTNAPGGLLDELRREIHQALARQSQAQKTPPKARNGIVITMVGEFHADIAQTCAIRHRTDEFEIRVEESPVEPPLEFAQQ